MSDIRDVKITISGDAGTVEFKPEQIIDRPIVHQSRRRALTGALVAITFYTKRLMVLRTWMQESDYSNLKGLVDAGEEVTVKKSTLVGSTWSDVLTFTGYIQHPFNPEHTDTLWRFELRIEES